MMFQTDVARIPSSLPTRVDRTFALRRGRAQWTSVVVGSVALLALPGVLSTFWLHLANVCLMAVIGAVALNILTGNARLVSLGQAAFLGTGAFTAGLLVRAFDAPFLLAILGAAFVGGTVGLIIGMVSLRLRVLYVAVTTIVLHFAAETLFAFIQAVILDSSGIILPIPTIGPLELTTPLHWYYFLLVVTALVVLGAINVLRSFIGRRWIAVGDHDLAAEALGVSVIWAKLTVFSATSAVVAAAGALSGYYFGVVSFEAYHFGLAIAYLAMIVVGGLGRVLGSILGAVIITLLPYVLDQAFLLVDVPLRSNILAGLHQIVFGGLIIGFLLFEPRGLAEIWNRIQSRVSDWPFRYRSVQRGTR